MLNAEKAIEATETVAHVRHPGRKESDLAAGFVSEFSIQNSAFIALPCTAERRYPSPHEDHVARRVSGGDDAVSQGSRSEEHTSELQSHVNLVCRLLLEKKKKKKKRKHKKGEQRRT